MDSVDERAFPHVASYLASLPQGLASHPHCKVKGAGLRVNLEGMPLEAARGRIPDALVDLARDPPPVSAWADEVKFVAITLAIRDLHFPSDEAFLAWMKAINSKMFQGPLYRVLMLAVSPGLLVRGLALRWSQFHQGSTLRGTLVDKTITGALTFPSYLFDALMSRAYGKAFEAAIEASAGKNAASELLELQPTSARFRCSWT